MKMLWAMPLALLLLAGLALLPLDAARAGDDDDDVDIGVFIGSGGFGLYVTDDHHRGGHHRHHGYHDKHYKHRRHHQGHGHGYGHGGPVYVHPPAHVYRPACHPVEKVDYWHGQLARIGGTMCYDSYGRAYIARGSRYVIEYLHPKHGPYAQYGEGW